MALISRPDLDSIDPALRSDYESGPERHAHFDELRATAGSVPGRTPRRGRHVRGHHEPRRAPQGTEGASLCGVLRCPPVRVRARRTRRWLTEHAGMAPSEVDALGRGEDLEYQSPAERALLAFARKVAATPFRTVASDVDALQTADCDELTIVEVLTVVSLSGWMNGYADALGLEVDYMDSPATDGS